MTRKFRIAAIAALTVAATVAATAVPAVAQVGVGFGVGYNDGWGSNDGWRGGAGGGFRSRGNGPGVSVGFGTGYDDWGYNSYTAAPGYGCTCAGRSSYSAYEPRYRSNARGRYPASNYNADYGYTDRSYATVGLGWSDGGWSNDGWRDRSFRGDRRGNVDRGVRTTARVNVDGYDREFRGGTRVNSRSSDNMRIGASSTFGSNGVADTGDGNGRSRTSVKARRNTDSGR